MHEKLYWLGFSVFPGIGAKKFARLLETFSSAENAWKVDKVDLENVLGKALTEKFTLFRKSFNLEQYAVMLEKKNIRIVTPLDGEYPKKLRETAIPTYIPPFLLFVKGNFSLLNSVRIIAVVGTRKITQYGLEVTKLLTSRLIQNGFTIVSGLALGVDATAHLTTVENKGNTIAVLGCGVDCCTPAANQYIYNKILDSNGTIISVFPLGTQATKGSFPARNAIIAGLSQGVLVTEGAEDSGALITAQRAQEFGRPVFAVPGPITSKYSEGANSLLSKGAIAVTDAQSILKTLKLEERGTLTSSLQTPNPSSHPPATQALRAGIQLPTSKAEQKILNMLQLNSMHFDEIVRKMETDAKSVGSILSLMEIKGMIKNRGGVYFI